MDISRSDCILREILEERKSLTGFLDAVFGFMSRNTDFYHIQETEDDKLGFPRGVKEQILMSCMQKYEHTSEQPKLKRDLIIDDAPIALEEIEIVTTENETIESINDDCEKLPQINEGDVVMKMESLDVKGNKKASKFNESEYKNGSVCGNYCWSQTLKDIELTMLLPKEIKLGKHIKIDFKPSHICIKALMPQENVLISDDTWDKYRHNDVVWTITDGKLLLSLDKVKECWWDKLFVNEEAINPKELDTERSVDEYSKETQNFIEKVHREQMLEKDIKTSALSQSEQLSRLRQAWNAEGSPFKGQTFDPSVIKFN